MKRYHLPLDFCFSKDDRKNVIRALQGARVPDPDGMADAIEAGLRWIFVKIEKFGFIVFHDPLPDLGRAQRQLLKARGPLRVIADHLELDGALTGTTPRDYWVRGSLNDALNRRGPGNTRDQVAGALALLDKLEKVNLRPEKRGRRSDDYIAERLVLGQIEKAFKERGVALRIGNPESPGIGVVGAVLRPVAGRRPTNDALYKRIRRIQRTGKI